MKVLEALLFIIVVSVTSAFFLFQISWIIVFLDLNCPTSVISGFHRPVNFPNSSYKLFVIYCLDLIDICLMVMVAIVNFLMLSSHYLIICLYPVFFGLLNFFFGNFIMLLMDLLKHQVPILTLEHIPIYLCLKLMVVFIYKLLLSLPSHVLIVLHT